MSKLDLFTSDPNWTAFAEKHGYLKPTPSPSPSLPVTLDIPSDRAEQAIDKARWSQDHPLSSVGYESLLSTIAVRDGTAISVKLSFPTSSRLATTKAKTKSKLAVLFVIHGGGSVQGTHVTEEAWLLWPLYPAFDMLIVSVEYRMAPEHPFPAWMDDSRDILDKLLSEPATFLSHFHLSSGSGSASSSHSSRGGAHPGVDIDIDTDKVILLGSSAGAGTAAYLSQTCRDKSIPNIYGVILNVPLLCDYRHLPADCLSSYEQVTTLLLSAGDMRAMWDVVIPSPTAGKNPKASPLLGNVKGLPRHLVFVAGQDPLRDEGLKYAQNLDEAAVEVKLYTYPGVPHTFAEFWELDATARFWEDLRSGLKAWLA
jgi:acetyl esterase/lipase